jgi:hypothetical protein
MQRVFYELRTERLCKIKGSLRSLTIFKLFSPLHTSVPSWSLFLIILMACSYHPLFLVSMPVKDKGTRTRVFYKPSPVCKPLLTFGNGCRLYGQLHAPATLTKRQTPLIPIKQEARCALQPAFAKSLAADRNRILIPRSYSSFSSHYTDSSIHVS